MQGMYGFQLSPSEEAATQNLLLYMILGLIMFGANQKPWLNSQMLLMAEKPNPMAEKSSAEKQVAEKPKSNAEKL